MIGTETQTTFSWLKAIFQLLSCVYTHPRKPVRAPLLLKTKDFFCFSPLSSLIILHDQGERMLRSTFI